MRTEAIQELLSGGRWYSYSVWNYVTDNLMLGCTYGNGLTGTRAYDLNHNRQTRAEQTLTSKPSVARLPWTSQ